MTSESPSKPEEQVRNGLKGLVARYRELKEKKGEKGLKDMSEANVRADFIDPLFEVLGWDVKNPDEYDRERYVRGAGLADIALLLDEKPAAFVEAKRFQSIPPVNRQEIDWIEQERQVMNYAMGQGIKWAVLTNFEKLRVFNALNGNLIFSVEEPYEYAEKVKYLLLLAKESFEKQVIKRFGEHEEKPDIDLGFLEKLNRWRKMLANSIYELNKDNGVLMEDGEFSMEGLKSAVQRLLDRMIIVRYAEDKLILENPDQLMAIKEGWKKTKDYMSLYGMVNDYFKGFDKIHDSRIFERGHICEKVKMDDEVLAKIIDDLYSVNFRKFDFDILGNTYETYLGNTLAFDNNGGIVLKPAQETRKKSGIYYTPPYVVDYIVKNTLGELLKGKSPDEIGKIRVLDPACGSGSFLIKAYDYFSRFYEEENEKIDEKRKELVKEIGSNGNGLGDYAALEGLKKYEGYEKEILLNNIYGVDLDEHAAEIASVNLMLKALRQKEKLPLILGDHIKVGNSLISGDEDTLKKYFGDNWKEKRSFNWEDEFPEVFQGDNPGFDVIIGNPPYVDSEEMTKTQPDLREFYSKVYNSAKGNWDLFCIFIEKALSLLKSGGIFGMIVPNKLISAEYSSELRNIILRYKIRSIRDYSDIDVFKEANVYPIVILIKKTENSDSILSFEIMKKKNGEIKVVHTKKIRQSELHKNIGNWSYTLQQKNNINLMNILRLKNVKMIEDLDKEEIIEISGAATVNESYVIKEMIKELSSETKSEYFKFINTGTIDRYSSLWGIVKTKYIKNSYEKPIVLKENLSNHYPKRFQQASSCKIIIGGMGKRLECFLDDGKYLAGKSTTIISVKSNIINIKYLLAILNSKLMSFLYLNMFKSLSMSGGYMNIGQRQLYKLPILIPDKKIQNNFAELADKMLSLNERLSEIDIDFERYVNRRPRVKDARLGDYLDMSRVETFKDAKGMDANRISCDGKTCKIKGADIEEQGDELIFSVELEEVGKDGERRRKLRIFGAKMEREAMRKFVYFSFGRFVKPSNVGKSGVYDKLLKVKLPRFEVSDKKNREVIHELMDEYLPKLEEWKEIKKEIDETDALIDKKVYELYGLTEDEIRIVEESFGDD